MAAEGCLDIVMPTYALDACQTLAPGQKLHLIGLSTKQDDTGDSTCTNPESIKLHAEKEGAMVTFRLMSTLMGSALKRELSHHWRCEVTFVSKPIDDIPPAMSRIGLPNPVGSVDDVSIPVEQALCIPKEEPEDLPEEHDIVPSEGELSQFGEDSDSSIYNGFDTDERSSNEQSTDSTTHDKKGEINSVPARNSQRRLKERKCSTSGKLFSCLPYLLKHHNTHYTPETKKKRKPRLRLNSMQGPKVAEVIPPKVRSRCCEYCGEVFNDRERFRYHVLKHKRKDIPKEELKKHVCDVCGKRFICQKVLANHQNSHTGERPYSCSICQKGFRSKEGYNLHKLQHTGERPFQCPECGVCFRQKGTMITHLRRHTGEKPYQCDLCPKAFVQRTMLKEHTRTHTGEKPFKCKYCDKTFKQSSGRSKHQRTHTREVQSTCDICGKGFIHKGNLKIHRRVHTGEKPFSCSFCGKCFSYQAHVKRHERIHTGEKPHQCQQCGERFIQKECLKRHMRKHAVQ